MSNDKKSSEVNVPTPSTVEGRDVHPVLAEVLAEKEPDTVSWVKG